LLTTQERKLWLKRNAFYFLRKGLKREAKFGAVKVEKTEKSIIFTISVSRMRILSKLKIKKRFVGTSCTKTNKMIKRLIHRSRG